MSGIYMMLKASELTPSIHDPNYVDPDSLAEEREAEMQRRCKKILESICKEDDSDSMFPRQRYGVARDKTKIPKRKKPKQDKSLWQTKKRKR